MAHSTALLRFIQVLPNVPISGEFSFKDLPGSGNRIDVLCRVLSSCFDWAPNVWSKDQIEVKAILSDTITLTFHNPSNIPIGETEWAQVIKDSLHGNSPAFVQSEYRCLDDVVEELSRVDSSRVWVLDEQGRKLDDENEFHRFAQNSFMLGDHRGFDSNSLQVIAKHKVGSLSLGITSYLGSHCVAAIISRLERMAQ